MTKQRRAKVAESALTEIYQGDRFENEQHAVMIHHRIVADPIASFAFEIMERFAMVAGTPDGEDAAGRAKIGLMPVADVVTRAFDIAELAYAEAEARGHTLKLPELYPQDGEAA